MKISKYLIILGFSIFVFACSKENSKSISNGPVLFDVDYNVDSKAFQTGLASTSLDNDVTALGRVLFYDDLLSVNGSKSCASCQIFTACNEAVSTNVVKIIWFDYRINKLFCSLYDWTFTCKKTIK